MKDNLLIISKFYGDEIDKKLFFIFQFLFFNNKAILNMFNSKTIYCKHNKGCLFGHLSKFIKMFCSAYGLRLGIGAIFFLIKIRK
jgi:ATP-dependent phosphoenolpyruvate carboxykinase